MRTYSTSNLVAMLHVALGPDAAMRLVQACGGKRIDVPRKVTVNFAALVGQDIAAVLVAHYGGMPVDVPSWGHAERMIRALRLNDDVVTSNLTANALAHKHGVTSMWVRKLRRRLKQTPPTPKPTTEKGHAPC